MPPRQPVILDPMLFTEEEKQTVSQLLNRVRSRLESQKGVLATLVHYKSTITPAAFSSDQSDAERYGLLRMRLGSTQDRPGVMLTKAMGGSFLVAFEVTLGTLTEMEKAHPEDAFKKRREAYATGQRTYVNVPEELVSLQNHLYSFLLDNYLPFGCKPLTA